MFSFFKILFNRIIVYIYFFTLIIIHSAIDLKCWANEDGSYIGYDSIVDELRSSSSSPSSIQNPANADPFANVQIHGGIGMLTSLQSLKTSDGTNHQGWQNGVEGRIGVDLFSPYWLAEGAIRRYNDTNFGRFTSASLHEFNLRLIYRTPPSHFLRYNFGMGLAARFLKLKNFSAGTLTTSHYSTPSSILSFGLEHPFTKDFNVGVEMSLRRAMINETADLSAFDASLKLSAHF